MEFRRKVYDELAQWKGTSQGHSAVLIQGARGVGKSTVVERFAKEQYRSYILIDFSKADDEVRRIFSDCKTDFDMLFNRLQLKIKVRLYDRDSAIIFDEVQAFPLAREMIKALVRDGRYDYMETGSHVNVSSKAAGIRNPSEEHKICMYPMDFEEWLWAKGDDVIAEMLRSFSERRENLGVGAHKAMLRKYLEYMMVGGMPQVVAAYLERHDLSEVEKIKRHILDQYRDDIRKHPKIVSKRALDLFDSIPVLLSSKHKVLSPVKVRQGTRMRDYDRATEWLCDAMVLNRCRCSSDPGAVMALSEDLGRVKCYLLDTGLLMSLAFRNDKDGLIEAYNSLMVGKSDFSRGMLFENMVAQELVCRGYDLWFTEFEKKGTDRKTEVDFILPSRSGMMPMEVKSGKSAMHSSLDKLMERYGNRISEAFVVHSKDFRVDGNVVYVPIYMMPFIKWK